jgi:hypothetical protein
MTKSPKTPRAAKAEAVTRVKATKASKAAPATAETPTSQPKGKLATLVELLSRPEGATIEAMTAATGWQAHSVRGAMSGSLKKAMGLAIASEKNEAGRVYRITEGAPA